MTEQEMNPFPVVYGNNLIQEVPHFVAPPYLVVTMGDLWPAFAAHFPPDCSPYLVHTLERKALEVELAKLARYRSVVGIGGGQAIDCAKYFSWRLNLPLFQFPTSLSVDAVFGHRSAVREQGLVKYVGWARPETVYLDYGVIQQAPAKINRAGVGDVFCFFTGVMDWRYAQRQGKCESKWPYDEALVRVSLEKAEAVLAALSDVRQLTDKGIQLMVSALRWGGASYQGSGWNPRHIEGVEHYIFYALEALTGKKFLHGQAVCLGIVAGAMMHQQRAAELLRAIVEVGVDIRPDSMGISWQDVRQALTGLKDFVRRQNYPYGIAHDFLVKESFITQLRQQVQAAYAMAGQIH